MSPSMCVGGMMNGSDELARACSRNSGRESMCSRPQCTVSPVRPLNPENRYFAGFACTACQSRWSA
ncbi:hypothetical protein MTQ17_02365 [Corynebacterium bovis]